jgi:mono/diheme cytochrome c family protein
MLRRLCGRLIYGAVLYGALALAACGKHESAHDGEHGMPDGWKFSLVKGDPAAGRELFTELECFKCHPIKGENFPAIAPDQKGLGPELAQMAGSHSIEFFVESIANPNAVIDADAKKEGHVGPDGRSLMPSFADVLTIKQLTDLATYLDSLSRVSGKH